MHFGTSVFRTWSRMSGLRGAELRQERAGHDPDSRGALAYLALAGEMLRREEELPMQL